MSTTDQLPEPDLGYIKTDVSNQPAFSARQMREAMQARFQAQSEPMAWLHWLHGPVRVFMNKDEAMMELDRLNREYPVDSGDRKMRPLILGDTAPQPAQATQATDYVGVEPDGIVIGFHEGNALVDHAGNLEEGNCLFLSPTIPTQATQAEVTDEQILEIAEPFGAFEYGDAQGDKRVDFARAILALRPERVPMTEDQVWHNDALMSANGTAGFKMDALMRIVRAVESHHG